MSHLSAGFLDQLLDVLHDFMGLFGRIMAVDVLCIIKVLRALPSQPDDLASRRHDGLAQIIVEPLLGVGFCGVECADARMGHRSCPLEVRQRSIPQAVKCRKTHFLTCA
jgi:hypothetical protein